MTWTDRYLAAVLRSIPESKRADVERELRSSIEDGIEERVGAGENRAAAERAVLERLGDPSQLAAAYTGRPDYLIGPELFPLYRQFVPRLIAAAVSIVAIVMLAVNLAGGSEVDDAIAAGIAGAINVAIQVAFWATVTFVFLEWAGPARQARSELVAATGHWTLERLPKVSDSRVSAPETAREIAAVLIGVGILVFVAGLTTTSASGSDVPLFDSAFTTPWLPLLLALIAIRALVHVMAYRAGRWSAWLATYHAALQVAFAVPVVVLALSGSIVNAAFADVVGWPGLADGAGPAMLAVAVGTTLVSVWEIVRAVRRARHPQGAAPLLDPSVRSA